MFRRFTLVFSALALLATLFGSGVSVNAQGPAVQVISNLNVRTGPGIDYSQLGTIPHGITVYVEGRNRIGDWSLIYTPDGLTRGWVASRYLNWRDIDIATIPVSDAVITDVVTAPSDVTVASEDAPLTTIAREAPLYQGPAVNFPLQTNLPVGSDFVLEGRTGNNAMLLGRTSDGRWRGWVAADRIRPGVNTSSLPVLDEVIGSETVYQQFISRLESTPVMPTISAETRELFRAGLRLGLRPNVFSKSGDCHTDNMAYLLPFGVGEYDLGPYPELQETIDFFGVSPRDGVANSFVNESMAASSAFTAAAVMDRVWADPTHCAAGQAPFTCELQLLRPSIVLIEFGSADIQVYEVQDFSYYIEAVLDDALLQGVIPVLMTFPSNENYLWEKSLQFNIVLLDIAAERGLPLINLWAALRPLPNRGLEADNFHLSERPDGRFINFNGDQNQYGMAMRNLVSLQALRVLQRSLLTR